MEKNPGEHDRITIPIASITERTRKILPGADAARATALKELQGLRNAKTAGYQRELERLRTKLGDRDPRVSDLERKVQTNERIVMNLGAEAQRAGTPPVVAAPGTWVCHGRVLDQSLHGESHVTVELIREQGAGDKGLTSARTDGTGYFKITVVGIDAHLPPAGAALPQLQSCTTAPRVRDSTTLEGPTSLAGADPTDSAARSASRSNASSGGPIAISNAVDDVSAQRGQAPPQAHWSVTGAECPSSAGMRAAVGRGRDGTIVPSACARSRAFWLKSGIRTR